MPSISGLIGNQNGRRLRDSQGVLREPALHQAIYGPLARLASQLADGRKYIDPPHFAKSRNREIVRLVMRDAVFFKAITQRLHEVAGSEWFLEAPDRESRAAIPYMEALLQQTPHFTNARYNLYASGVLEGIGALKICGARKRMKIAPDGIVRNWWHVGFLGHIPGDAIGREWTTEPMVDEEGPWEKREYYWKTLDLERKRWLRVHRDQERWYAILQYHDDGYSLSHGQPLLDSLYFYWHAKTHIMKFLLQGVERYAVPWILARIKGFRSMGNDSGPGFEGSSTRAAMLLDMFERARAGNVLILDAEDEAEVLDFNGEAANGLIGLLSYFDNAAVSAILGSLLPSGQGESVGSLARAEVERQQQAALLRYDRDALEEALQHVVRVIWEENRANFAGIKSPSGAYIAAMQCPRIRLRERPLTLTDALEVLNSGQPLLRREFYKAAGFTMPDDGDDVVGGQQGLLAEQLAAAAAQAGDPNAGAMLPPLPEDDGLQASERNWRRLHEPAEDPRPRGAGSWLDDVHRGAA